MSRKSNSKKEISTLFVSLTIFVFLELGLTPCKAKQPLQGMELQEKEEQRD